MHQSIQIRAGVVENEMNLTMTDTNIRGDRWDGLQGQMSESLEVQDRRQDHSQRLTLEDKGLGGGYLWPLRE